MADIRIIPFELAAPCSVQDVRTASLNVNLLESAKEGVRALLLQAVTNAVNAGSLPNVPLPNFVVELPTDATHGELATNIALVSAKAFAAAPRAIAQQILDHFPQNKSIEKVEIAGPGFINLFFTSDYFSAIVMAACACGDDYGRTNFGENQKVNVEFVSANPTGPMHLGNARGAALGDTLASSLEWAGYKVTREFYLNDAGNQITKFAKSLSLRYLQLVNGDDTIEFPEDCYQGTDITEHAANFLAIEGKSWAFKPIEELEEAITNYALPLNISALKENLEKYRVHHDVWFSEKSLHDSGAVVAAVEKLKANGAAYEKDGAIWYNATASGSEKDEVLVRANSVPTYFAADIAYHANKFERGFTRAIDAWGSDHHGHVARMKNAMTAIGYDGDKLEIVLFQFVNLLRNGQPARMSKRSGNAITLSTLLDEVPIDSVRFFFNSREVGSTIDFDLDLAVTEDSNNPVYYVQYAHARICSMLRALSDEGLLLQEAAAFASLQLLSSEAERALIRQIALLPSEIIAVTKCNDPARLTHYISTLAALFHKFYTNCRIKGEEESIQQARLALTLAAKNALANVLSILKISAPQQM